MSKIYITEEALVLFGATKANAKKHCEALNDTIQVYNIYQNKQRVSQFLAQVFQESGALSRVKENLNYTTPQRLMAVWPSRFKTIESATPFVKNPEALANNVYGNRMGNTEQGDGFKYIGRGLKQITGKDNYKKIGDKLRIDIIAQPELLQQPLYACLSAGAYWDIINGNRIADIDNKETVKIITKLVNGGLSGLSERTILQNKIRRYYDEMDAQACEK